MSGGRRGSVRWYVDRLASMSPSEVALHARRRVRYRVDDTIWRRARPSWRRAWDPPDSRVFLRPVELGASLAVLGAERAVCVREAAAGDVDPLLAAADRWLDDRIQLLGYPEVIVPFGGDPWLDPFTGRRWPDRHGRLLDYRRDTPGDPKWIWDIHRRQEVPLLALCWLLTGERRYADGGLARLRAALAQPPGRGIAWANAFEPGIRALSLAIGFDALRSYDGLTADGARSIARGLWQHGHWIVRDRSVRSSANNHLVGELAGLLAVSLLVPELRDAERWGELATRELSREAGLQVRPDGSGAEQSFGYTLFVLDLLLTAAALLESRGRPVPEQLQAAFRRGARALALLVDRGEPDPAFGDADGGRALVLDGREQRSAQGVAASLAACSGDPGCVRLAGSLDATAAVLFGARGVERFRSSTGSAAPADAVLPDAGLAVLRRGGTRLLFDAGPLGYLSIAAHGHADALHVSLSHGAEELIADPGAGSYFGRPELRAELRGTGSHATVTVDARDQAEARGPFLWSHHTHAELTFAHVEAGVVVGSHDGYLRLDDPVRHRRAVVALGGGAFVVYDRLDARTEHELALVWPFAPSLAVVGRGADGVDGLGSEVALGVRVCASVEATGEVEPSSFSRRLEEVVPTSRYVTRATFAGRADLATLLVVAAEQPVGEVVLEVQPDGVCVVSCVLGPSDRRIVFDLDNRERPVDIGSAVRESER